MNIGKKLHLKQGSNHIYVTINKLIANVPSNTLYLAFDDKGEKYIFSVYDGLRTMYSIGRYEDGLYGTKVCTIKVSLKDRIKGWLDL